MRDCIENIEGEHMSVLTQIGVGGEYREDPFEF
jgi:hypothetical protein